MFLIVYGLFKQSITIYVYFYMDNILAEYGRF